VEAGRQPSKAAEAKAVAATASKPTDTRALNSGTAAD
jgi:hypothetical protein